MPPSSIKLSVIICTHNPYKDYLKQTLAGLSRQTLATDEWELIIVDNMSEPPLSAELASDWHPHAKVVIETELGLTHARLKGIHESASPLLVFVDDDNVLNADYLKTAWELGETFPFLGAWGAGNILPEFEGVPDQNIVPYTSSLSLRSQNEVRWSNVNYITECSPMGAGMCIRKNIAELWVSNVKSSALRQNLGRRGASFGMCEDSDLALTACDIGMGNGVFPELQITHLISKNRYAVDYLIKNSYGWNYSVTLFGSIRRKDPRLKESQFLRLLKLVLKSPLFNLSASRLDRAMRWAAARGTYDALNQLKAKIS